MCPRDANTGLGEGGGGVPEAATTDLRGLEGHNHQPSSVCLHAPVHRCAPSTATIQAPCTPGQRDPPHPTPEAKKWRNAATNVCCSQTHSQQQTRHNARHREGCLTLYPTERTMNEKVFQLIETSSVAE